jgi:uncharacterized protein
MLTARNVRWSLMALLALVALLAVACGPASVQGQSVAAPGARTITVIGQGEAFGTPDQAEVQVGVEIFAPTVAQATTENEGIIEAILEALGDLGIAERDIQTTNYSLFAEQRYGDNGPEGIVGYRVSNQVNVTIRDISAVGEVLQATMDAGANSIYGVRFSVADPAELQNEARAAAMADARARGEALAELGSVSLGEIVSISEQMGAIPFDMGMGGGRAFVETAAQPSISPGEMAFSVQVQVTYAIN